MLLSLKMSTMIQQFALSSSSHDICKILGDDFYLAIYLMNLYVLFCIWAVISQPTEVVSR